jgi:hypothetical protein
MSSVQLWNMVTAADGGNAGAAAAVAWDLNQSNQWKPWNPLVPNRRTTFFTG